MTNETPKEFADRLKTIEDNITQDLRAIITFYYPDLNPYLCKLICRAVARDLDQEVNRYKSIQDCIE